MRLRRIHGWLAGMLLAMAAARGGVVDRVAVVVGKQVLTESEVVNDLRLTEFLNREPLDLGPAARRTAADHLVEQELIRREIKLSGFVPPAASEADSLLRSFRQERFPSAAEYRAALAQYGITETELKSRLLWQVTAVRFVDFRFGQQTAAGTAADGTDQRMDAWLKQARADTKISLKPEAFR